MLSFFPRGVSDEILNLIESVSEEFPSYSCFLWLLLKTRTCTEYTVIVVSFKIPIHYYLLVLILKETITLENLVYAII